MTAYILRRLLLMVPVALFVTIILFVVLRLTPGDPAQIELGEQATPETIAALHHQLGLDRPLVVQYEIWVVRLLHGDLGKSLANGQPVSSAIGERFPATLGPSLFHAMIAVGITGVPRFMRFTRGQVLRARELDYVAAGVAIGASRRRIVLRHILPNIADPLIVVGSLAAGGAILAEAALSFLGVGAQPPTPDLGSMINSARDYLQNQAWLAAGPGVAIFLIVWSFANLGDALRDALDPRLRER